VVFVHEGFQLLRLLSLSWQEFSGLFSTPFNFLTQKLHLRVVCKKFYQEIRNSGKEGTWQAFSKNQISWSGFAG
jgi:hypothetical protein